MGKDKDLFMLFKRVIEGERKAQEIYKRAIAVCEDAELKEIFKSFLEDEERHEKEIMGRYNALKRRLPKEETE